MNTFHAIKRVLLGAGLGLVLGCDTAAAGTIVRFQTTAGDFDVELFDDLTPVTVANFLQYVNDGDYTNTFIHRSAPGFVIQGGGFGVQGTSVFVVPKDPPIVNEPYVSNTRGTITMAKVADDPDSATSQWFFNLVDNSANLDNQNGGFSVFGQVLGTGMADVVDPIAALPICTPPNTNPASFCDQFTQLPVINPTSSPQVNELVYVFNVAVQQRRDDVIVNFDGAQGFSAILDNDAASTPARLHPSLKPVQTLTGDVDGNGQDDVIAYFDTASPAGVYIKRNLGGWQLMVGLAPASMQVGRLDANAQEDIVIRFANGLFFARMNDATWKQLSNVPPDQFVLGDVDGNGLDDIIADFTSTVGNVFAKLNLGGWSQVCNCPGPEMLATANLDNDSSNGEEIIIDFGKPGFGLFMRSWPAPFGWTQLHGSLSPDAVVAGDVDGNGQADIVATFAGLGLFAKLNLGSWTSLHPAVPDHVAIGDIDDSGVQDVVADFGTTIGGIHARRDNGAWELLNAADGSGLATGEINLQ